MDFALSDWMLYTMWGVLGLMFLDFLIAFFRSFWKGSFNTAFVLEYLKDVLYFVIPLNIIVSMIPMDPTGWILVIFYFAGGIAVIIKYIVDIKGKLINK
ncbi:hypothetical protein [Peribacillus alkalitolerans]|uniref:hypothetical protein n=1 Tax=Peribacillus alkalitolerans TaxID=1550385 RepID=UPI0013D0A1CD|nr:hypothetical protein [Peribacillus alkalitolerans]